MFKPGGDEMICMARPLPALHRQSGLMTSQGRNELAISMVEEVACSRGRGSVHYLYNSDCKRAVANAPRELEKN